MQDSKKPFPAGINGITDGKGTGNLDANSDDSFQKSSPTEYKFELLISICYLFLVWLPDPLNSGNSDSHDIHIILAK
jgi:hypothetical protein